MLIFTTFSEVIGSVEQHSSAASINLTTSSFQVTPAGGHENSDHNEQKKKCELRAFPPSGRSRLDYTSFVHRWRCRQRTITWLRQNVEVEVTNRKQNKKSPWQHTTWYAHVRFRFHIFVQGCDQGIFWSPHWSTCICCSCD